MLRQPTISEAICVGALCVFAIGTAHAADPAATDRKNEYKIAVKNADADYKAAKEACKSSIASRCAVREGIFAPERLAPPRNL